MTAPLVSCLCVTEGRAAFLPWLLWTFDRQTWPDRELVIVDSSPQPFVSSRADVRVMPQPPGTGVARKRTLALAAAAGAIVTWFDDDDWQHPDKLALQVAALADGAPYAGSSAAWFVDLHAARCAPFSAPGWTIFNSAAFRRAAVEAVPFDATCVRGSDSRWLRAVARTLGPGAVIPRDDLVGWLVHAANLSNPAWRRPCPSPLAVLRAHVGAAAWGDTDDALAALRARLQAAPAAVPAGQRVAAAGPAADDASPSPDPSPPIPPDVAPSYHLDARYIRRLRRAPHVTNENHRVFLRSFELDLERGQGLATGQGADPMVLLRISRDGGQTWGEAQRMSAGTLGAYTQRVIARRLGQARDTVFEVTVSDPIAWSLVGAWLDVEPGTS